MRTYEEILQEIIEGDFNSQNITTKSPESRAAKEYAKMWIHEFACQTFINVDTYDYRGVLSDLEPEILKRIEEQ